MCVDVAAVDLRWEPEIYLRIFHLRVKYSIADPLHSTTAVLTAVSLRRFPVLVLWRICRLLLVFSAAGTKQVKQTEVKYVDNSPLNLCCACSRTRGSVVLFLSAPLASRSVVSRASELSLPGSLYNCMCMQVHVFVTDLLSSTSNPESLLIRWYSGTRGQDTFTAVVRRSGSSLRGG